DVAIGEYEVDQYEDDDVCGDASSIGADCVAQRHTLAPHDDIDWLKFDGLRGITYRVFTYDIEPYITDPDIYVYSGDCGSLTLIGSDDVPGLGQSGSVEFFCEETGTYYVEVRQHTSGEIGSYYYIAVCSELWPMVGCDKGHRGYMNAEGPTTNKVEWARTFGQFDLNAYASLDQTGRIFVSATDGTLYAVLPNGRLDWQYPTGLASDWGPVVDHAGNAVLALRGGMVSSVGPDGALNWALSTPLPAEITAPPTISDTGAAFFGLEDSSIAAAVADSGLAIMGYPFTPPPPVSGRVVGSPAIDSEGFVYFTTEGNVDVFNVFCIDPRSAVSLRWRSHVPPVILTAAPTLSHDDAELYVGGMDGVLYALDTNSGGNLWNFATGGPIVGSVAVHPDVGMVFIPSEDGSLYCVDPASPSAAVWEYATGGPIHSSPAVDIAGRIYFGSDDGFFYCLNPDGSLLWSYDFGIPVDSSPSLDSYGFVYITVGHELFVFDEWVPDPRAPESSCDCPAKVTSPLIPVTWVSRDNKSGVKSVSLWYRYSSGGTWGNWTDSGLVGYAEIGTFNFVPTQEGIYEFYTIAEDYAGNVEGAPASADCSCLYNTAYPESSCTSPEYDNAMPIPVQFTSNAVNGIFQTVLWYRYNGGAWTCSGQAKQASGGTIYFGVNLGNGTYDFYSVAIDAIGNEELRPTASTQPDTTTIYDMIRPVSSCWLTADGDYTSDSTIPIQFRGYDGLSGLNETVLYYRIGSGDWIDSGLSSTGAEGTFEFDTSATGEVKYDFTTVSEDNAGNVELGPSTAKASVVYDATAPESTCTLNSLTDTEILLNYDVVDSNLIVEVQLWYRLAFGDWAMHPKKGSGSSGMFTFVPLLGDGTYEFYTVAVDAAENVEPPAGLPDVLSIYFDVKAPESHCSAPAIATFNEIQVGFHVLELNNGVKEVKLFERFNDGDWEYTGLSRHGNDQGVFEVRLYDGDGAYGFYTTAEDYLGNIEDVPDTADAVVLLDREAPVSSCSSGEIASSAVISIAYEAQDAVSGVNRTKLFSSYNGAKFTDTGLVGYESSGAFSFDAILGDGEYAFYTVGVDEAGHRERIPDMPDTVTILDTQAPFSQCSCPSVTNATEVTVTFLAGDEGLGSVTVSLWFSFNFGVPEDSGLSMTAGTGAFDFELMHGEGIYSFFTLATDSGGNVEAAKDMECSVLYDATAPVSTCTSSTYANKSPLSIAFDAEDPDISFSIDGSGVRGTCLWYRFKRYAGVEFGDWQDSGVRMDLAEGTFSLWAKDGEGFYDLQTRADDRAGNVEALKDEPDCSVIYDVTPPASFCTSPGTVYEPKILIDYNVYEITSGLARVTLWYKFENGEFESSRITRTSPRGQITFMPKDGQGSYYFYTIGVDNAGNVERGPLEPDCQTIYALNEPDISVSPMSIDFGTLPPALGRTVTAYIEVSNVGLLPLNISDILIDTMIPAFTSTAGAMTIAAGASQLIDVSFSPPGLGQFNATLAITSNDPDEPLVEVTLTGQGAASMQNPSIRVAPQDLGFGTVTLGETKAGNFTVTNIGGADLVIYSVQNQQMVSVFSDARGASYYPHVVPPNGGTMTIRINFKPTAASDYSTFFVIRHNDFYTDLTSPGATTVACTGTGVTGGGPSIHVTPDRLDFGRVTVRTTAERSVTVSNVGGADLIITGMETVGSQTAYTDGQAPSWYPHVLQPGESTEMVRRFTPPTPGSYPGRFAILSNDPENPSYRVATTGEGVSGAGGPDIRLSHDDIRFGVVHLGGVADLSVEISNVGTADLEVSSLDVESSTPTVFGAFYNGSFPIVIAPGGSERISVTFHPAGEGDETGEVHVNSNDPGSPQLTITLSGVGSIGDDDYPVLNVSPRILDFGEVPVGSTKEMTITARNDGAVVLYIYRMVTPEPFGDGQDVSWYPFWVLPGSSVEMTVTFSPTESGFYNEGIGVSSNDPDWLAGRIEVTGTGVAGYRGPELSVSADKFSVHAGEELAISFGIQNPGPALAVDLLGAVVLPDGTFLFYPGFSMEPQPVFIRVAEAAAIGPIEILRVPFSNALPKGQYVFYAAVLNPYNYDMQIEGDIASATWVFE
ncbi:MAG TPA: choice-of-anchor D domain-containing protein, partial [bacterium]|nr:choice-of-anchor D domain-containing protein [bacterium]